jgi:hypothetical protein
VLNDSKNQGPLMKFSKAAMKSRHVKLAHMAVMPPTETIADERTTGPARTYSTERYAPIKSNNGIPIPQELRDNIEASIETEELQEGYPMAFLSGGRGFF